MKKAAVCKPLNKMQDMFDHILVMVSSFSLFNNTSILTRATHGLLS